MQNTLYTGDNLPILRALPDKSIDLVYLDPPFNTKRAFAGKEGSKAAAAKFKDSWSWDDVSDADAIDLFTAFPRVRTLIDFISPQDPALQAYVCWLGLRIVELRRVLNDSGSMYLHCDPTASHYLKLFCDAVFGRLRFKNQITWKRKETVHNLASRAMGKNTDIVFWYVKSNEYSYNRQFLPYDPEYIASKYKHEDARGLYTTQPCVNNTGGNEPYDYRGSYGKWRFCKETMDEKFARNELMRVAEGRPWYYKKYLDDAEGVPVQTLWDDIAPASGTEEDSGWPTQKPLDLLRRIVRASSAEGDTILDPFSGSSTALIAAQELNRRWIGIELDPEAPAVLQGRLPQVGLDPADWVHKEGVDDAR